MDKNRKLFPSVFHFNTKLSKYVKCKLMFWVRPLSNIISIKINLWWNVQHQYFFNLITNIFINDDLVQQYLAKATDDRNWLIINLSTRIDVFISWTNFDCIYFCIFSHFKFIELIKWIDYAETLMEQLEAGRQPMLLCGQTGQTSPVQLIKHQADTPDRQARMAADEPMETEAAPCNDPESQKR